MIDKDFKLKVKGFRVCASPLFAERGSSARNNVYKRLNLPILTIEEILPVSTPEIPVGGPSISIVEKNLDIPVAEVVSPAEVITKVKTFL